MNTFTNDSNVLFLQHALEDARSDRREAEDIGCSDALILELMDKEDAIVSKLLSLGWHLRDC